ncbi:neprilysin-1-like [Dermacentor variabilis]|uniref:neprilysin-1-like n=1 Tax=Dermacentor variabilis TaxID=34621 RepID=UPI003F5AFA4D
MDQHSLPTKDSDAGEVRRCTGISPALMSRRGLIITAIFVLSASAIVAVTAIALRRRQRPEPLPPLPNLGPSLENSWETSWRTRHLPLYFKCDSNACRDTGEDLRKNVAWSLSPCADFYEYVCTSNRFPTNVYDHAVTQYLREVRSVIRKYEDLGFFSRTAMSKKITRFFATCQSSHVDLPSWRSQLEDTWKHLQLAGDAEAVESMLATFSRVLEIFPVVHVAVLEASHKTCVVLSRPHDNGADRIFHVPHAFSTSFRHFAADLLGHKGKINDDISDLISSAAKVESELQKYSGPRGEQYYHVNEYGDVPASEIGEDSAAFDWTSYLRKFLSGAVSVKADSCVIVKSPAYVKHLVKVFGKVSKNDVRSFLKLRAAMALMPFRKLADNPKKEEIEKLCTLATYKLYQYAFLKEFNDTYLLAVAFGVHRNLVTMKGSYKHVITEALPISKGRTEVDEALSNIKVKYFQIMKDVDSYYSGIAMTPTKEIARSYVQGMGSMTKPWLRVVVASGGKIQENHLNVRWDFDVDTSTLLVPVSISHLKQKEDKEFFLESASLGGAMVQFFYEAFHERALFSSNGSTHDVHNNATAIACLEKQYASKAVNNTKVHGQRVLRTVAADNAIVPVLHRVFKTSLHLRNIEFVNYKSLEMSLANLPDVDADQLFFLMYGQTLCEPHEDTSRILEQAPWPPAKIRLNTALANYPEFANAFSCGNRTAMNPKKRCSVFHFK